MQREFQSFGFYLKLLLLFQIFCICKYFLYIAIIMKQKIYILKFNINQTIHKNVKLKSFILILLFNLQFFLKKDIN